MPTKTIEIPVTWFRKVGISIATRPLERELEARNIEREDIEEISIFGVPQILRNDFRIEVRPKSLWQERGIKKGDIIPIEITYGEAKIPTKNKLIVLHMRWFYDSPRGKGHDTSVERIASAVVSPNADMGAIKQEMMKILRADVFNEPNADTLEGHMAEEILGFEIKDTEEEEREIKVEEASKWLHQLDQPIQLSLNAYL